MKQHKSRCKVTSSVAGNIGVGKTTLCEQLSKKFTKNHYIHEELENPHLVPFYEYLKENPKQPNPHAFNLQKYFLEERFKKEQ